jgi:hypothetical protein
MDPRMEQPPATVDEVRKLFDAVDWGADERRLRHMVQVFRLWIAQDQRRCEEQAAKVMAEDGSR